MDGFDAGVLLIRLVTGGVFLGHGAQLLFGWFGGGGLPRTRASFHRMGFRPALPFALAAATTQFVCGTAVTVGLFWPLPPLLLIGPMTVAVVRVHWPRIWVTEQGIEYPLVLAVTMAGLGLLPVGRASVDHAAGIHLPQYAAYWLALAAALLGACCALVTSWWTRRRAMAQANPVEGAATPGG